jgi:uncharacterized metal-binding protein YceD (DUF177 family)
MDEEFSHKLRASHIHEPQTHVLAADATARAALAKRFGLPEIAALRGEFTLAHERAGVIAASLAMHAKITQTCVVSLEPFDTRLDESAALRFVPAASLPENDELELDPESLEGPDEIPYADDMIDLGAALAEQLGLALDPYPRKPGAALPETASEAPETPFSVLKLRPK